MAAASDPLSILTKDLETAKSRAAALVTESHIPKGWDRWLAASKEWRSAAVRLGDWVTETEVALLAGEPRAVDRALTYLERDLYYFWSGFQREHVARRLAGAAMTAGERARAREYV